MEAHFDEKNLVNRILDGQVDEFQRIIESYQKLVWHVVSRMVAKSDCEDLCQDIFIKVYKNLRSFKFESKLSTWIGRIAYNCSVNHLQKKKPDLYEDVSPEGMTLDSLESESILPDMSADNQNIAEILREEISLLPSQYRTILTLFHLEEMTYNEISKITKLPDGTVKSHLFRARKMLKERLEMKYVKEDLCQ